jgi:hypothetical protein
MKRMCRVTPRKVPAPEKPTAKNVRSLHAVAEASAILPLVSRHSEKISRLKGPTYGNKLSHRYEESQVR